jgi:hypothetical protein
MTYTRIFTPPRDSAILQQTPCPYCSQVGNPLVTCTVCGLRKGPRGRSVPLETANSYCGWDCHGYTNEPEPESLWPGERWVDSLPCLAVSKCIDGTVPHPGPHQFTFSTPVDPSEVGVVWALAVPQWRADDGLWYLDDYPPLPGEEDDDPNYRSAIVAAATVENAQRQCRSNRYNDGFEWELCDSVGCSARKRWLVTLSAARWLDEPITDMECPTCGGRGFIETGQQREIDCVACGGYVLSNGTHAHGLGRIPLVAPPVGGLTARSEP